MDSGSCVMETSKRDWTSSRILASSSVEAKVMARLDVEPELSDVVEVCQAWEDGLVVL